VRVHTVLHSGFMLPMSWRSSLVASRQQDVLAARRLASAAAYCQLFGRNLETGQPAAYDDALWRRVIARLELSETQVCCCNAAALLLGMRCAVSWVLLCRALHWRRVIARLELSKMQVNSVPGSAMYAAAMLLSLC
jgi:hypothetical protein